MAEVKKDLRKTLAHIHNPQCSISLHIKVMIAKINWITQTGAGACPAAVSRTRDSEWGLGSVAVLTGQAAS